MLTRRTLGQMLVAAPLASIAVAKATSGTEPSEYFIIVQDRGAWPERYLHGASYMMWSNDPGDAEPFTTEDDAMRGAQYHGLLRPAGEDDGGPGYAVLMTGFDIRRVTG